MGNNIECLEIVLIRASYLDSIDFISIIEKLEFLFEKIGVYPQLDTKNKIIKNFIKIILFIKLKY